MYEPFTEHKFNSIPPKHTAKAAQGIRKARNSFARILRLNKKVSPPRFLLKIPQPDRGINPQTQCCCSLGALAFPGLRLLATYKLLGIFESILDAPSARKTAYHLGGGKTQIRGKEKIVFLLAGRVSTDYQKHRFLRYPVPDNLSDIYKVFFVLASFARLNPFSVGYSFRQFFRRQKLFAFLARSASCLRSFLARQIVNIRIPTHTRDYMCIGYILYYQRGVKSVRTAQKTPLGQPESDFCEHLAGKFYQGWPILSVQSHIDRQAKGFATPERIYSQRKNDNIQSPGVDYVCTGRANCVPPPACTIDFSAAAMKQGVVQIDRYYTLWVKYPEQQNSQKSPQLAHCPGSIREKAMISIVSFLSSRVCKWQDAGDGMFCGAENPSGYEIEKNFCRGNREYWEKVLNYIRPCRDSIYGVHTNLPFLCFPGISSEGWCVYDNSSSKLAANLSHP